MADPYPFSLSPDYLRAQADRCVRTLQQITERPDPSKPGRVIPGHDDIAIHDGRRIDAAVMFLDICGFSKLPSWTPQEQLSVLQMISFFFTEMVRIVEDYGGVVEKNTGDGLMAYFASAPNGTMTVQTRALTAALTMFAATQEIINPVLIRSRIEPLQFRICMDHGPLTIARVGAARGFNGIVAVGTIANIASKMLAKAGPDTILLGTKMMAGLPKTWVERFVVHETNDTGFFWTEGGRPYEFWRYEGRWTIPQE